MKKLHALIISEFRLFLREPMGAFFTLIFPPMLLLLFGSIWGNSSTNYSGGHGYIDQAVPAFSAMVIATAGLISLSIQISEYRDRGILKRFRLTPIHPLSILIAQVVVIFAVSACGMGLLIILGKLIWNMRFDGQILSAIAAFILASASFASFGFVLASVLPTARTAQIVAMVIFYPNLFFSGSMLPREALPETIRMIAKFMPLTHVVDLLRGVWIGAPWSDHWLAVGYLTGLIIAGLLISKKLFRWE
ncbi:ABC transporter permease [bacterium]|nr:ABC transporter permease [bacterium]